MLIAVDITICSVAIGFPGFFAQPGGPLTRYPSAVRPPGQRFEIPSLLPSMSVLMSCVNGGVVTRDQHHLAVLHRRVADLRGL